MEVVPLSNLAKGEVATLLEGSSPFKRREQKIHFGEVQIEYLSSGKIIWQPADRLVYPIKQTEGEEPMSTKLKANDLVEITVDGATQYGNYLTVNSSGQYVVEMKPSGDLKAFDKASVEKVMPYTVGVKFGSSQVYSFFSEEGAVEVGDVILRTDAGYEGSIGVVTEVNTKSNKATKELKGRVLETREI